MKEQKTGRNEVDDWYLAHLAHSAQCGHELPGTFVLDGYARDDGRKREWGEWSRRKMRKTKRMG